DPVPGTYGRRYGKENQKYCGPLPKFKPISVASVQVFFMGQRAHFFEKINPKSKEHNKPQKEKQRKTAFFQGPVKIGTFAVNDRIIGFGVGTVIYIAMGPVKDIMP